MYIFAVNFRIGDAFVPYFIAEYYDYCIAGKGNT